VEGFSGYISPNLNGSRWSLEYKLGVTVRTDTKIRRNQSRGCTSGYAKTCFVLLLCHQYKVNFRPLILHRIWPLLKQKTRIGVRMRKPVKVSQFPRRSFTGQLKLGYFQGGVCDKATAQTAQSRAMEIISGTSRHPKNVGLPFVSEFWWRPYGLGAISPRKK